MRRTAVILATAAVLAGVAAYVVSCTKGLPVSTDMNGSSIYQDADIQPGELKAAKPDGGSKGPGTMHLSAAGTPNTASVSASQGPSLPPLDTPLKDSYASLKERADAGEPAASCRLSFELNRCHQLGNARSIAEKMVNKEASKTSSDSTVPTSLMEVSDLIKRDEKVCDSIASATTKDAWRYLLKAAQAGHVPSMVRFAV